MKIQFVKMMALGCLLGSLLFLGLQSETWAGDLMNGDFEAGNLAGWTSFTTPNGTIGGEEFPGCVNFDANGDGFASKSAEFKVGQQQYQADGPSLAGGGIATNIQLEGGAIMVSADIASSYSSPKDRRNLAGGLFELLVDGIVIASHNFGPIPNNTTQRLTLEGWAQIATGMHELRVRILRPFRSLPQDHAPRQYLDNIRLTRPSTR